MAFTETATLRLLLEFGSFHAGLRAVESLIIDFTQAIIGTVKGAADLQETVNKTAEVFGASTGKVTAFADEMAKTFGTPRREILDTASSIGLIAKGAGYSQEAAAGLSIQLARLADDASSFYNVPVADALARIQSGLVGQERPLREFGVLISESAVKAEAFRLGIATGKGALDDATKVQARASLIIQGLATATGDHARTQHDATGSAREFSGRMQDISDRIGGALLPAFTDMIGTVNEVAKSFQGSLDVSGGAFGDFVAFVQGAVDTLGVLWRNWGDVVALAGVNVAEQIDYVGKVIWEFLGWFEDNWVNIFDDALQASLDVIGSFAKNFKDFFISLFEFLKDPRHNEFTFKFTPLLEGFQARTKAFELPEPDTSAFDARRRALLGNIEANEREHDERVAARRAKAPGQGPAPEQEEAARTIAGAGKDLKAEFIGAADIASRAQAAALSGKDRTGEAILEEAKKTNAHLERIQKFQTVAQAVFGP